MSAISTPTGPGGAERRRSPRRRVRRRLPLCLAFLACAACSGKSDRHGATGETGGTVIIATGAEPKTLLPPLAANTVEQQIVSQIFDRLAEIGDSLNTVGDVAFRPRLARKWTWAPDSLSIAFALDPSAKWHDGKPVRAADVKFSFDLAVDPATGSPTAPLLANIDSVSTPDSVTAVFWYKRRTPQQFFDATYQLWIIPQHLLRAVPHNRLAASPFGRKPVGSGRFRFEEWTPGQRVEIVADEDNYRGRANLDRVVWTVAPDFGAATISLINGQADFFEAMSPSYIGQLARNRSLRIVPYPGLTYGFLGFNLRAADGSPRPHPIFGDRETRRALSMAVDRVRIVQSVFDSLAYVAYGPNVRALFPDWAKLRQIPYNPGQARALLDSLGWRDANGDGVRERGGVKLSFSLLVPTSSGPRLRMAVLLQEQLRTSGVEVKIEQLELNTFLDRQRQHLFDAAMGAWQMDPNRATIQQMWGSQGAMPNGSNFSAYESPTFDAQVDSALSTYDPARSRTYWAHAYQTILDDAPAVWLFEPRLVAGAHRRIKLTGIRADGWWVGLADWSIPSRDRIGRDRIGLR
ncbi:ABC-type transporter, periplasmic subunit [Gemmatirosa kalamazoonensis]|uniref:ABC-type transporter, periplasmic subunit n=1 Tax=Gemmatirosa kalamazoonensis TaxID=861299 RepID=W0RIS4_9BACT|nr:peptide ABC transporter substrate-binding protein [Gemmatirosa kalamazoonensis]AHG90220.1 ABC-type transporter, periplasmic subunit [Gemmatirosa kalamazoonensis]